MKVPREYYRRYLLGSAAATIALTAGCLGNGDEPEGDDDELEGAADAALETVTAGTEPGFPPFEMVEDGELVGFDVDLLEGALEESGAYELDGWEELEFGSLIPALNEGNIDVIAAAMTITEEREEQIAFSDPYYSAEQSVLVAADGTFQPESFADFDGQSVGAQSGTTGETIVEEELIESGAIDDGEYSSFDSYVLAVEDLERGILDAVVLDEPVGETFADDRDVEVAFVFETGEEFGLGVRQDDTELLEALNEGIAALEDAGTYDELVAEWFE